MYFHILKKDLQRKRAMNVILLTFIVLAAMFISSSVNNIFAVSNALDYYFEKAGMPDYYLGTTNMEENGIQQMAEILDTTPSITSYKEEPFLSPDSGEIKSGKTIIDMHSSTATITPFEKRAIRFFDKSNEEITSVAEGETYIPKDVMDNNSLSEGDKLSVTIGKTTVSLTVKGCLKDAYLGSDLISMSRILISQADFDRLNGDEAASSHLSYLFYVNTNDVPALEKRLSTSSLNILFMGDEAMIKWTYIMNMAVAGTLLVVSVCLILISFAVLNFTIKFTLEEEFREIGIMKAIGIRNVKIRGLYLTKYFAFSCTGAAIGFLLGIPFGDLLLKSVSESMVLESKTGYLINAVCAVLMVALIMLFCFHCTRKVNQYTPIDAVRNGTTGERFTRKSRLALSKSRLHPTLFLALNDIMSSLRRYAIMIFTFTIGLTLIIVIANTVNTLKSGNLVEWLCLKKCDVYFSVENYSELFTGNVRSNIQTKLDELETVLNENHMSGTCSTDIQFKLSLKKDDKSCNSIVFQGVNTATSDYAYLNGTPPQNEGEIAITPLIAEKLGATIGDEITVTDMSGSREYLVTALFQSMSNIGEGVRLPGNVDISSTQAVGISAWQIDFDDNPNDAEIAKRIEKLRGLYPDCDIYNSSEYVDVMVGQTADIVDGVKLLIIPLVLTICVLVSVLMERSFIAKEKGEIAMLKAVGFSNGAVVTYHTLRILIVLLISILLGAAISSPVSQLTSGKVFQMMGAQYISFAIKPAEVFVLYPLLMLFVTLLAVFLTAQYTRMIAADETSNIE